MKGIERSIDKLGRIVLPVSFREQLNITTDDKIVISLDKDKIILSPSKIHCALCSSSLHNSAEIRLCEDCIRLIKENF